ncbi:MAG: hypothetical protein JJ974_03415 [Phycisphaerales bacterium]|nr:hypothetical protein [Phycisphaerales bacterium]
MAHHIRMAALSAAVLTATTAQAVQSSSSNDRYRTVNELRDDLSRFAQEHSSIQYSTIGSSLNGSPLSLITIADDVNKADQQPALLITAGIDGRYTSSSEIAARIADRLVSDYPDLLKEMTVYIIPQLNPDGAGMNMQSLRHEVIGNARATDDDRDRATDEDGPDDLNGDGYITIMRRLNPPIDDQATHFSDPDNPLLNIKPDPKEGQRATFSIYPEGLDNDKDGKINEDSIGSVDLDSNFMHRWLEHDRDAGRYPLSEPESLAIAQFVLNHDNIVMALTIGRHDNLINQPDAKAKDITGTAPKAIDAKDADLYKAIGEIYKETTSATEAPKSDIAGSFHAWLYAQRGIPSFAAVPWTRPTSESGGSGDGKDSTDAGADQAEVEGNGLTPSGVGDISMETLDELRDAYESMTGESVDESMIANITPEMVEGFAAQLGIEIRRVVEAEPVENTAPAKSSEKKAKSKKKSDEQKWLDYFEEAGINGFVDWEPYDHPTLGQVEIGGFVPGVRINPPATELDSSAEKMTAFVAQLIEYRPIVNTIGPEVNELADGLYEVHFSVVNDGKMPTSTAHSRSSRATKPTIIRLSTDVDHIITGQRVSRVWGIDAHGGRSDHHWILRTDNLADERIEIIDPRFGNRTIELGE